MTLLLSKIDKNRPQMAKGIKTGGRQKGTQNKVTGTTKEMISQIVTRELPRLPGLLDQMGPKEKVDCILKLLPYIMPKLAPVEAPKEQSPSERNRMLFQMFKAQSSQNTVVK